MNRPSTVELDDAAFVEACQRLAHYAADFRPHLVVGIATGGAFVARAIQDELPGSPDIAIVSLSRPATGVKQRVLPRRFLAALPSSLANAMRWAEVEFRELAIGRSPAESTRSPIVEHDLPDKLAQASRVLVVDDTVDSGRTLSVVADYLQQQAEHLVIRTAVLASTWRAPPVVPDYCLFERTLLRNPWSLDARAG